MMMTKQQLIRFLQTFGDYQKDFNRLAQKICGTNCVNYYFFEISVHCDDEEALPLAQILGCSVEELSDGFTHNDVCWKNCGGDMGISTLNPEEDKALVGLVEQNYLDLKSQSSDFRWSYAPDVKSGTGLLFLYTKATKAEVLTILPAEPFDWTEDSCSFLFEDLQVAICFEQ